jgi:hypothetical protein
MSLASGTKALGALALGNQYEFVTDHNICKLPAKHRLRSSRAIGFVLQKKRRSRLLPLVLWRLPKAHAWPATVFVDELDASGLKRVANDLQR